MRLKNPLDCRGPLQTGWSRRRQEEDEATLARCIIELLLECRQVVAQNLQVGLIGRCLGIPEELPPEEATHCERRNDEGELTWCHELLSRQASQSARRLAASWGMASTTKTRIAAAHTRATVDRLEREHDDLR